LVSRYVAQDSRATSKGGVQAGVRSEEVTVCSVGSDLSLSRHGRMWRTSAAGVKCEFVSRSIVGCDAMKIKDGEVD
jgi:hypothetical protein